MKKVSTLLLCAAMALPAATALPTMAEAKVLERACNKSDRGASRALCSCIQRVADFELSRSEQRKGAKFFREPQLAQDTRQSDRPDNEVFWKKWKKFGDSAAASCS
ncbi:hypothetical protein [Vannielia litorea]|uniref:hypothetical protein n=1 Tax=Vannielia litorea TaxID=1217970 RepID=UPI001FD19984|nr:hypothetical protein [Vannielia litorea]